MKTWNEKSFVISNFFSLGRLITIKGIVYHFQVEADHNLLVQYLNKQSEWNVFEAGIHNFSKSLIGGVAYIQSNCPTSESSFCNDDIEY